MSDIKVAVLDKFHPHIKVAITAAMPSNWSVRFIEENSLAARAAVLRDADIAFVMAAPVPKELLAEARRLRFIQKLGAGVDRIDLDACRKQGIGLARLHAGNSVPVAEHTILLMLATYRQLPQIDRRTRAGAWNKEDARGEHRHLHGKIVGLVGFGAIGKEVAKRLRGFEVKILLLRSGARIARRRAKPCRRLRRSRHAGAIRRYYFAATAANAPNRRVD